LQLKLHLLVTIHTTSAQKFINTTNAEQEGGLATN